INSYSRSFTRAFKRERTRSTGALPPLTRRLGSSRKTPPSVSICWLPPSISLVFLPILGVFRGYSGFLQIRIANEIFAVWDQKDIFGHRLFPEAFPACRSKITSVAPALPSRIFQASCAALLSKTTSVRQRS